MTVKFARLEFELFTKPYKLDFSVLLKSQVIPTKEAFKVRFKLGQLFECPWLPLPVIFDGRSGE